MVGYDGGFCVIPRRLRALENLRAEDKLVFLSLVRHFNTEREIAWPSLDTIATENGLHKSAVQRSIKRLEDVGLVALVPIPDRKHPSAEYRILWKNLDKMLGFSRAKRLILGMKRAGIEPYIKSVVDGRPEIGFKPIPSLVKELGETPNLFSEFQEMVKKSAEASS